MTTRWYQTNRTRYAPIIAKVLADARRTGASPSETRRRLRDAFPNPPRQYWPYDCWLKEIRKQTGLEPPTQMLLRRSRARQLYGTENSCLPL